MLEEEEAKPFLESSSTLPCFFFLLRNLIITYVDSWSQRTIWMTFFGSSKKKSSRPPFTYVATRCTLTSRTSLCNDGSPWTWALMSRQSIDVMLRETKTNTKKNNVFFCEDQSLTSVFVGWIFTKRKQE